MPPLTSQTGAASIEFTVSFVFLLVLLYGIVGFTMPLLLSASYQQAASDALREALVWQHRQQATDEAVKEHVQDTLAVTASSAVPCQDEAQDETQEQEKAYFFRVDEKQDGLWRVCLSPSPATMLPPINLLGIEFPPLPEEIKVTAALYTR